MIIPIVNPTKYLKEKTYLTAKYTSGTSLSVKNSNNFADNDIILIGEIGYERSETTDLTATPPDATTLTVSTLNFSHAKDSVVYKILYDQVVIERSINSGTSYSVLATIDLQYDKKLTLYEDTSGQSSYLYRIKFKNSATGGTTNVSDVQLGSGWPKNSVGHMVRQIRTIIGDMKKAQVEDWQIFDVLSDARDDIETEVQRAFWNHRSQTYSTTASDFDYALPTRFKEMDKILYTYNPNANTNTRYPLEYMPRSEWLYYTQDQNREDDDHLHSWTLLPGDSDNPDGYIGLYPTPSTSSETFEVWYYQYEPEMNSYGDTTDCPMPQAYVYYAVMTLTKDDQQRAEYLAKYNRIVGQLQKRQNRDGAPRSLKRGQKLKRLFGRGAIRRTEAEKENYW